MRKEGRVSEATAIERGDATPFCSTLIDRGFGGKGRAGAIEARELMHLTDAFAPAPAPVEPPGGYGGYGDDELVFV